MKAKIIDTEQAIKDYLCEDTITENMMIYQLTYDGFGLNFSFDRTPCRCSYGTCNHAMILEVKDKSGNIVAREVDDPSAYLVLKSAILTLLGKGLIEC